MVEVRRDGYAWTRAEFAEEVNGLAAPILDGTGEAVGAINISGPTYRFPGARGVEEVGRQIRAMADRFTLRHVAL